MSLRMDRRRSKDDLEVLAYLISSSGDPNHISRPKREKPKKMIITLLFSSVIASAATRVTGLGEISKLLHKIIGAFEDSLEMKKRKKDKRKRSEKSSVRVNDDRVDSMSWGSNSGELADGDSVDEGNCGE